jgi:Zn-dependent protease with chaperone function
VVIAVDCPHCGKQLRVKGELAGHTGKCPQCHRSFEAPRTAARSLSAAGNRPDEVRAQVLAAFGGNIVPPQVGIVRKAGALLVLAVLLLLPLFYAAVIGGLIYGMVWLATSSIGRGLSPAIFWAVEAIAGLVLICLIKPLVERQRRSVERYRVDLNQEVLLREFLSRICEQVAAPPPQLVQFECSTRLAASARRGGQLTLGLPLVACLSVEQLAGLIAGQMALVRRGAGCGVTNFIRGINGWLWRSVYGQSRFDQWLALVAERPHFHLAKLLLPLAAGKLVVQAVLFVPMFIANTIASGVVRMAELDADRTAVRLMGRPAFAALLERIELIDFTWEGVVAELEFLHREQALPDSLPQQLALRMLDMTPELCAVLRETVNKPDEKPFDSKASNPERLEALGGEPTSGVVACSLAARSLSADYDKLARQMTWDFYSARYGAQLLKTGMKPVVLP